MVRKWKILSEDKKKIILDVLLENRGIKTKKEREEFLNPTLESFSLETVGIDPSSVRKTIKKIKQSIKKNEKIIIYGDYDVDGICGTAILWETLFSFYKNVMPHIPHRVEEGYGLSIKGIEHITKEHGKIGLIITVDNGIVANDAVDYAKKHGIDVIITDHHVSSDKLPNAYAIIHTTQLCGAGVAYLLAKELNTEYSILNTDKHLELVALATVADLVPLIGPNRALVKFGIESLKSTKRAGLLALYEEAQIRKEDVDVYKIGHMIVPRLNASGRIAHAMDSLRLICTGDVLRAKKLAGQLGQTNKDRRVMTEEATAYAEVITEVSEKIIIAHDTRYNQGIIGLVASRLVEKHYKPSIVISVGDKFSKGSARSIRDFNIIEFLRTHSAHLVDVGGHPMAAGFTIETPRIEDFKKLLIKQSLAIPDGLFEKTLNVDMELNFDDLSKKFYSEMQKLEPFGMGNPEPIFVSKNVNIENARFVGRENKHLKLSLSQNGKTFDAIYFNGGELDLKIGDNINTAYSLKQDSWNGNERIQLKIKDFNFS